MYEKYKENHRMTTLHIFNPEHDMALASGQPRFIAPHAGRQLRADLGYVPAFWANDNDLVLVDEVEGALEAVRHLKRYAHDVAFVNKADLARMDVRMIDCIEPWGWDGKLCTELLDAQPELKPLLPADALLEEMRRLSHRRFAAENVLPQLKTLDSRLTGESICCTSVEQALQQVECRADSVLKAPWSGSGRGLRYVRRTLTAHERGWMNNVVARQGSVMVEPRYRKVCDFGMEFYASADGVRYQGLSLFQTENGAYAGSVLATEQDKEKMMERYVSAGLLQRVRQGIVDILTPLLCGIYTGAFGVDMMIVAGTADAFLLHPCVEVNLRRTMGHTALALSPDAFSARGVMRIGYTGGRYRLKVTPVIDNLLNTSMA